MKLPPFRLHRPGSVEEASRLLTDLGDALAHVSVELDSALRLKIGGHQNVDVGLVPSEQ